MIAPDILNTAIARLKIYEASVQMAKTASPEMDLNLDKPNHKYDGLNDGLNPTRLEQDELRQAIDSLEAMQTQILPGSLVRHKVTGEVGRVITIFNTNGFDDTYVAFWGNERLMPNKAPNPRPYVLRYCLSSLERLAEDNVAHPTITSS
ncbi:MAG: hypothetical protein AAGD25_05230 [Cyanobacteria bacterium P01_F01_bin.150]